ncbi:MAG TPA: hypothetical protein VK619_01275 [Pyrinomonadaceae bacterium]|nr:hypothetical protein [Pyrinomonadaceae bacterium]
MDTNVNLSAPIGVLAFLGACFVALLLFAVLAYAVTTRRGWLAKRVLQLAAASAAIYFGLLIVFSLVSSERVLALGHEKHFCEIDCHLAYAVADVQKTRTVGNEPNQQSAQGMFYVITLKVRFDETTISPTRGSGLLYPNSRALAVTDDQGRKYEVSMEGQKALENVEGKQTELTTPLRPGEFYLTKLVFDLPADARGARLLVNESDLPTHFIIGHENSPLHKKTEFTLEARE